MKKNKTVLIFSVALFTIVSCGGSQADITSHDIEFLPNEDTIQKDSAFVPVFYAAPAVYSISDTNQSVDILFESTYHGEELEEELQEKEWLGIFESSGKYTIEKTTPDFERVNDPIVDADESEQTGWLVACDDNTDPILMLSGIDLELKDINAVQLETTEFYPGDSVTFEFNKKSYLLFATGRKDGDLYSTDPTSFITEDYKLFLQTEKNGTVMTELLLEQESFDATMSSISFAGDIDQDGALDFLINTTRHYNSSRPTLYLSSPADENHLLQIVGWLHTSGC